MGATRKTTTVTYRQNEGIEEQILAGGFTNHSEHIRDRTRRDQDQNAKSQALKLAIQEGLDSGVSDETVPQIISVAETLPRADGRLSVQREGERRS